MQDLAVYAFAIAFGAVIFWGSIRLVDGHNVNNKLSYAIVWSGLAMVVVLIQNTMGLFGYFAVLGWLIFVLRLLTGFYNIGLLRTLIVLAVMGVAPYLLKPLLVDTVGGSESMSWFVVVALPVAVFGIVLRPWYLARKAKKAEQPPIPVARVEKRKKPEPEPVKASGPAPTHESLPPPPRRSAPIPRPSAPIIAPKIERPGDSVASEPSFLR